MQGKRQNAIKRLAARQTLRTSVQANRAMQNAGQAVQNSAEPSEETPTNYAESTAKTAMQDAAATAGNVTMETARLSYAKFKAMQAKRQQNTAALENAAAESAVEPVEASKEAAKPAPAMPSDRRKAVQRKQFQEQAVTAKKSAAKDTMPSIIPESERRAVTQQILKKRHITAQAVRQKLAEKENTDALPHIVFKLPQVSKRAAVRENLRDTVQYALRELRAALAKIGKAAAGTLLPLLGAGGVVLLLALVIGAAAAVIGSPMGILFADESSDPNSIPIHEIVSEANTQFAEAVNDIVTARPECSVTEFHYEYEDGHTWASYWPEVLAVYAVNANLNSDTDVVVLDRAHADEIIDTFWLMH